MIPKCEGCKEELNMALFEQDINGLHIATITDDEQTYPFGKHHFYLIMVDDNGKVMIH